MPTASALPSTNSILAFPFDSTLKSTLALCSLNTALPSVLKAISELPAVVPPITTASAVPELSVGCSTDPVSVHSLEPPPPLPAASHESTPEPSVCSCSPADPLSPGN